MNLHSEVKLFGHHGTFPPYSHPNLLLYLAALWPGWGRCIPEAKNLNTLIVIDPFFSLSESKAVFCSARRKQCRAYESPHRKLIPTWESRILVSVMLVRHTLSASREMSSYFIMLKNKAAIATFFYLPKLATQLHYTSCMKHWHWQSVEKQLFYLCFILGWTDSVTVDSCNYFFQKYPL